MIYNNIKRGEIFYIHADAVQTIGSEQRPGRPGIIISGDQINTNARTVEIVYTTTSAKQALTTHVIVHSTPRESTALCEQITTVAVERIGNHIGSCTKSEMEAIDKAVLASLGFKPKGESSKGDQKSEPAVQSTAMVELEMYKNLYNSLLDKLVHGKAGVA